LRERKRESQRERVEREWASTAEAAVMLFSFSFSSPTEGQDTSNARSTCVLPSCSGNFDTAGCGAT